MGLPGALGSLPLAPLVPEYETLTRLQHDAGLRHFGQAVVADGETLSFVDGLFVHVGPRRRYVSASRLNDRAAAHAAHAPLLRLLAEIQNRDAALLRRVLLHQLITLLRDSGGRLDAAELGLVPGESTILAQAAGTIPVLDARQRKAAESLGRLWEQRRLRTLARTLTGLGPVALGADPALARLDARLGLRLGRCDRELAAARAAQQADAARTHYLDALRIAADDPAATRGLIHLERPRRAAAAPLTARLTEDRVVLSWPVPDDRGWRAFRLTRGADRLTVVPVTPSKPGDRSAAGTDQDPQRGTLVRYAVFPLRDGVPEGPPLVSHPLLVAPDVEDLTVTDGPARLTARWTRPSRTDRVTAALLGAGGAVVARQQVGAGVDTYTFTGLRPGTYTVEVVCHHPPVESAGVRVPAVVHRWPEQVAALVAEPDPESGLRFRVRGGEGAEVRLVTWPEPEPVPAAGTGLRADALPAPLPWAAHGTPHAVEPPSAYAGPVVAVSVLGEKAVVGPSVRVDVPAPVTGLRGIRETDGRVRLVFDWPPGAGAVEVAWEQNGVRDRLRVSRSVFVREGLRLPTGPAAVRVSLRAAPRETPASPPGPGNGNGNGTTAGTGAGSGAGGGTGTGVRTTAVTLKYPRTLPAPGTRATPAAATPPATAADDVVVIARRTPALLDLPGEVVVTFRLTVRRARRGLARKQPVGALVEVMVRGAGGTGPLPDFLLVGRTGDAASARPRNPEDGDVLLRLGGDELAAAPETLRELPGTLFRPPYALRAFLVGEGAAEARLQEPALSTLVVR
ncbi:hypothetical protein AB0G79_27575 [Streptomyces sp. NPDC020807]|uniref:hypothetical protein n=1 Tax=Streptomyces sp. NPDC020807 TaxID=3155119 RepID=UPI0033E5A901